MENKNTTLESSIEACSDELTNSVNSEILRFLDKGQIIRRDYNSKWLKLLNAVLNQHYKNFILKVDVLDSKMRIELIFKLGRNEDRKRKATGKEAGQRN